MNWMTESIGIFGGLAILVSMCFKTMSFKGSVLMRTINIVGCIGFVVYGSLLPAISTAVLNGILVFVNLYHLLVLIKNHKNELKE